MNSRSGDVEPATLEIVQTLVGHSVVAAERANDAAVADDEQRRTGMLPRKVDE